MRKLSAAILLVGPYAGGAIGADLPRAPQSAAVASVYKRTGVYISGNVANSISPAPTTLHCNADGCRRGPIGDKWQLTPAVTPGIETDVQGMRYFDEAKVIWKTKVPSEGQADTVEGELLRAVEKLRREGRDNGNINWDAGFEILLGYLKLHLLDAGVYPADILVATKGILDQLSDPEYPVVEDGPYDELADRVVEWYRHYGSQPHVRNPNLHR
ncbi:hypothetical protein [Bradyrhizobium sp. CCGUVB23]|uniref:hypothetical protein n=1 Tax=Bradyrhizobium sp. CCGUVB23 TaxID=2949630 RepID=UPI0020B453B3|nr:hypothetical protein [Bradyrhizobium sp. CCGUVB23]MCP3466790.1 hypothetical protein [Bradyrhizobium sp. CCGUVB23]